MVSTCMQSAEVSTRGAYLWGDGRHGEHMHAEREGLRGAYRSMGSRSLIIWGSFSRSFGVRRST